MSASRCQFAGYLADNSYEQPTHPRFVTDLGLSVHGFGRRLVVTHNGHRSRLDQLMSIDLENLIRKEPDELSERGLIRETGQKPVLCTKNVLSGFRPIADDRDILPALV